MTIVIPPQRDEEENIATKASQDEKIKKKDIWTDKITIKNILRVCVVLTCSIMFICCATKIIIKWNECSTVINLSYIRPNESDFPGITLCGPYIMCPSKLHKMMYDGCNYRFDFKQYRENKEEYLKEFTKNQTLVKWFHEDHCQCQENAFGNYSSKRIFDESFSANDLIRSCVVHTMKSRDKQRMEDDLKKIIPCENIAPIHKSIYEGRKCFTLFSEFSSWSKDYSDSKMIFDMNPSIVIKVTVRKLFWFAGPEKSIQITVHPSNMIPTSLEFGFTTISDQNSYDIKFTKKMNFLLEKPYKTACKRYPKEENLGSGKREHRSQNECMLHCINKKSKMRHDCLNYHGVLMEEMMDANQHLCNQSVQNYTGFVAARRECKSECAPDCDQVLYEIYGNVESFHDPMKCKDGIIDDNEGLCDAEVTIKLHHSPFTLVKHKPSLTFFEMIGSLGGHAEIWLGLSAIAIFNLVISFVEKVKKKAILLK